MAMEDRKLRMAEIVRGQNVAKDFPLLKVLAISPVHRVRLENAVIVYLQETLSSWNKDFEGRVESNFFDRHLDAIVDLPNITPNGLILPKRETVLSFNLLHKAFAGWLKSLNMDAHFERMQMLLNVRLVQGTQNVERDGRPRASRKPHTDIWAAEPAHSINIFLPLYGDLKRTGVEFYEPRDFPAELVRPIDDYQLGGHLMDGATQYDAKFEGGHAYVCDSFVLHQTMQAGGGPRLSLEFRFLAQPRVPSDVYVDSPRIQDYLLPEQWYNLGMEQLVISRNRLQRFEGKDTPNAGYSAAVELVQL